MKSHARDLGAAIIILFIWSLVVGATAGQIAGATADQTGAGFAFLFAVALFVFLMWVDHRLRKRHRITPFWLAHWRIWVIPMPAFLLYGLPLGLVQESSFPRYVENLFTFTYWVTALYIGMRWVSRFHRKQLAAEDVKVFE